MNQSSVTAEGPASAFTPQVIHGEGIRVLRNSLCADRQVSYDQLDGTALSAEGFDAAAQEITSWPGYAPTPLLMLPGLAASLGVASLACKDEGKRFALKSFKALGGAYAVLRATRAHSTERRANMTVTCATDGNHGRSVAWGAQLFGCRCVIFVHETVSATRCAEIARFGADVRRVPGNYDDAVRHAAAQADANGWTVVSDTSWPGYEAIPRDVMHGYGLLAREICAQWQEPPPTHVLLQAGVGAMAASICAVFWQHWGANRPAVVVVEPTSADCHYASALAGRPVPVTGDLETIMAGLACGEVSMLAWPVVSAATQAFVALDDDPVREAMRRFADPGAGDPAIVSGETGACGLGALLAARTNPDIASLLNLNADSRVLLIGSEADTDSGIYTSIVGRPASEVAP